MVGAGSSGPRQIPSTSPKGVVIGSKRPITARVGGPDSAAVVEVGATPANTPTAAEKKATDPAAKVLADKMAKDRAAGNTDQAIRDAASAGVTQEAHQPTASPTESKEMSGPTSSQVGTVNAEGQASTDTTTTQTTEQQLVRFETPAADSAITVGLTALEIQIKAAQERGEKTQQQEALLFALRLARGAQTEMGALLKLHTLRQLQASGVQGLDPVITDLQSRTMSAQLETVGMVAGLDPSANPQEILKQVHEYGLSGELVEKLLAGPNLENMDVKILGRELTQGELEQMKNTRLIPEAKKKYGGLLMLLLVLGYSLAGSALSSLKGGEQR